MKMLSFLPKGSFEILMRRQLGLIANLQDKARSHCLPYDRAGFETKPKRLQRCSG